MKHLVLLAGLGLASAATQYTVSEKVINDYSVQFTSSSEGQTNRFDVSVNGLPYVRQTNMESSFSHRAGLLRLVEYNDTISPLESTSKCSVVDKKSQFAKFTIDNFGIGTNSSAWHVSTIMTGGEEYPSITVMLDTMVVSETRTVNDVTYQPDEIHASYTIAGFPYKYANSKLAFVQLIQSGEEIALNSTVKKLTFGNTNYAYVFDYNQILSDDKANPIKASVFGDKLYDYTGGAIPNDDGAFDSEKSKLLIITFPVEKPAKLQFNASLTKRLNENKKVSKPSTTSTDSNTSGTSSPSPSNQDNSQTSAASLSSTVGWAAGVFGLILLVLAQ